MNKKLTTAGAALSPVSYISPAAKVTEIHSEGVLCISVIQKSTLSVDPWEDGEFSWQ